MGWLLNVHVVSTTLSHQHVALRRENGENTTKTSSDDEMDARNGFFTLTLVYDRWESTLLVV